MVFGEPGALIVREPAKLPNRDDREAADCVLQPAGVLGDHKSTSRYLWVLVGSGFANLRASIAAGRQRVFVTLATACAPAAY